MIRRKLQYRFSYNALVIITLFASFSCVRPEPAPVGGYYAPYNQGRPYPERYETYSQPHSRAYKKPYDVAPYQYYPYYDYDQYYVPPTQYKNIENIERGTNATDGKY